MRAAFLKQSSVLLLSASVLAACGGGGDSPAGRSADPSTRELTFAYPADGQTEIATPAPVVLRFTDRVDTAAVENDVTLTRVDTGDSVAFTATPVGNDGRTLLLQPGQDLAAHTEYRVDLQSLQLDNGVGNLTFTTRAAQRGPRSETITSEQFALNRRYPSGGSQEPVMDFSTFRYQFSQPIDRATATYGVDGNVRIEDSNGDLVEARLLVDGPYMTVDPVPDYLTPGEEYRLYLEDGLASTYGVPLDGENIRFTPKDSSPDGEPAILVQKVTVPGDPGTGDGTSRLTGKPINQVPVNATLLGNNSATQSEGDVHAELASSVVYPQVTPIRVPRATLLIGSNIDVMIGGAVPAGISSGQVKMHFLSDATGYLTSNPYSTRDDALRQIRLFMDVAIATENPEANGGFTQDLLHIELVGMAEVDTNAGVLNLDAVSMVEPDVLGQEFAHGLLSFQLQSYPDQTNAPERMVDTTPPTLQSWTLEDLTAQGGPDKSKMAKPGDPIILNFDEPLDPQSVEGKVTLYKTDNSGVLEQDIDYYLDGSALVVKPKEPLQYSEELNPIEYRLQLGSGVMDLSGNLLQEAFDEMASLAIKTQQRIQLSGPTGDPSGATTSVVTRSAYISGLYPGYPCYIEPSTTDLIMENAGRCAGGLPSGSNELPEDDHLPIMRMGADRPIMISFSKSIDPDSVSLGRSFQVHRLDSQGNIESSVEGEIITVGKTITFIPNEPWIDGQLYSYVLGSNGDINSNNAVCDSSDPVNSSICDLSGLPIQTRLLGEIEVQDLEDPDPFQIMPFNIGTTALASADGGGPDMTQYFFGDMASDNVLQKLSTEPVSDTNGNLMHDTERDVLTIEQHLNFFWAFAVTFYGYEQPEPGPTNTPDPFTQGKTSQGGHLIDPGGTRPSPNSAKILSTFYSINDIADFPVPVTGSSNAVQVGANIGCGYESYDPLPDQTGCVTFSDQCYSATPSECPDDKFTYLNSTIFGEVTNKTDPQKGLKVHLFPGKVVTTSFYTILKGGPGNISTPSQSGYQVMRMRYGKDNPDCIESATNACARNQPIIGWITEKNGQPVFEAEVDLYLNAPELQKFVTDSLFLSFAYHNFYSYQTTLRLSGPVTFLQDGRMIIEQFNLDPVYFDLYGNSPGPVMEIHLQIPERGSYLKYISTPIK
ncbi:MAG: Ig-like domain-containing protein [Alcanivorax sp.]|nr:Ig-like domain-containing protein [Alcanivorax sp.]